MTELVYSAHDLCVTRLCQAGGCEQDAEPGWPLCARHDRMHRRGIKIVLHEIPDHIGDTLECNVCKQQKLDEAFTPDKRRHTRRFRSHECRECKNARTRTPEGRAKQNAYRKARRAEYAAEREANG